jgi:hypothetical protein
MGARRAVASRVGATVVDGRKMRAAADDRGQQGKLEKIVKKKKKILKAVPYVFSRTITNVHQVQYRTVRPYMILILRKIYMGFHNIWQINRTVYSIHMITRIQDRT